jgi:5-(carboxyamino)imidazole ribonucleotide synthase
VIVGILGGGQLGRMLALAGYPLGLRFRLFDPAPDACAGQLAELVVGEYDVRAALDRFATGLDVVTYEFENVPVAAARYLAERLPVYPPPVALKIAQDRLNEKRFFEGIGVATSPYHAVSSHAELEAAVAEIGLPAVLKTRREGYDGKGQVVLREAAELDAAWNALGERPLLLEGFVPFEREVSTLGVRGRDGDIRVYPLVENVHRAGILRRSTAPANATPRLAADAKAVMQAALQALDYVGVLAIEFFVADGQLLANEMAPRVHNTGHWTIDGAVTSQFENHLRAVAGLPLGDSVALSESRMLNIIGKLPDVAGLLAIPDAHLHLYGKEPRPGRKLGHVTLRITDHEAGEVYFQTARRIIAGPD